MNRRIVVATMASLMSFTTVSNLHAAPMNPFHHTAAAAKPATGKMVSFSVRNDAKTTLVLKAGEQQYTIEPGKTAALKLSEGCQIVNVSGTEKQAAGSVLTTVAKELQGNTLAIS